VFFREKSTLLEIAGILLVVIGIILILFLR
jgi:multidrug transporter EmrE-like cation transporter